MVTEIGLCLSILARRLIFLFSLEHAWYHFHFAGFLLLILWGHIQCKKVVAVLDEVVQNWIAYNTHACLARLVFISCMCHPCL
jgi:hypothetical protein